MRLVPPSKLLLEIAIGSARDAKVARDAGADRLELNSALELGGLTPSQGFIAQVADWCGDDLELLAMARPRPGGFVYNIDEYAQMVAEVRQLVLTPIHGVAFGVLTQDRRIDLEKASVIVHHLGVKQAIFHRAFDLVADPISALDDLISIGVVRVMTSGGSRTAVEGLDRIKALIAHSRGRIEIMPAGGVRSANLAILSEIAGLRSVHAGPAHWSRDDNGIGGTSVSLGVGPSADEWAFREICPEEVKALRSVADAYESSGV